MSAHKSYFTRKMARNVEGRVKSLINFVNRLNSVNRE
jgi:hypothetical protein